MTNIITLEVRKDDWATTRVVTETLDAPLQDGEVLLRVDRQALTSNNISYASSGDLLGYWGFFPAEDGWGRIPAMGWADVVESRHPEVEQGERVWGFFPFSTHLKIHAGNATGTHFDDISSHRAEYAPVYARFDRTSANPIYDPALEDHDALLRGLYLTSWLVEDFLHTSDKHAANYGASACLVTSASSKTSIALAHCLKRRGELTSIGLTSEGNRAFCESLGYYDKVVSYDEIAQLDAAQPVVLVDMAGSAKVISDAHHHFGDNMRHSCQVGATHYEEMGSTEGLPGATPEFFFAPGHIQTRSAELGAHTLMQSLATDYIGFRKDSDDWIKIEFSAGPDAVEALYQRILAGSSDPASGQMFSMHG